MISGKTQCCWVFLNVCFYLFGLHEWSSIWLHDVAEQTRISTADVNNTLSADPLQRWASISSRPPVFRGLSLIVLPDMHKVQIPAQQPQILKPTPEPETPLCIQTTSFCKTNVFIIPSGRQQRKLLENNPGLNLGDWDWGSAMLCSVES